MSFDRDRPHDVRPGLFGGRGVVRVWNLAPALVPPFAAALACELDPQGSVGAHVQTDLAEIVICVCGAGAVVVNGARRGFAPGEVVNIEVGHALAIENLADEPLRYFIIKAMPAE